mgnify:CR=1 FL=1
MKIGILTYHSSHNYGAFLQAYALVYALREETNHDVEIIDFSMKCAEKMNRQVVFFNKRQFESIYFNLKKYIMFENAKKEYAPISKERCVSDSLEDFIHFISNRYDVIITGSDEVWKMDGYRGFPNPYWLPGIENCLKIAYAVSSRNEKDKLSSKQIAQCRNLALDYDYIGVRDDATKTLIETILGPGKCIHKNCDPTFAYKFNADKDRGEMILRRKFGIDTNKKVIGLMCGVVGLGKQIVEVLKDDYQIVSLYYYYRNTKGFAVIDPFEWIDVIAALDGLITTFFHGMVFAIKYDTPFISIENREISDVMFSKHYALLNEYSLADRCVLYRNGQEDVVVSKVKSFIDENVKTQKNINFSDVREGEREKFNSFLRDLKTLTE